jgi:hypothetical protein
MRTERNREENCKIRQQNETEEENPRGTNVKGKACKKRQEVNQKQG